MNEKRMMKQITAIFGVFMTFFYVGIGLYVALSGAFNIDKAVTSLFGFTFVFYGIYRGFRSFQLIRDVFFSREEEDDNKG